MKNIGYKMVSCLSILLALILMYDLVKELRDGMSFFDIYFLPFLTALIIIGNGVLAFLLVAGIIKPQKPLLILQIFIIIPTCILLCQILFNSTISCS
ncbi:hypothetical protein AU378_01270 [Chryseobacterium kwangjuense]|uniref:Uncharacterized protein n=1 Tax=Chryseobacterium kwangjuense TaxID=267125 RepID=A0A135WHM5_9FLAO|nr:hypothetical protein AU378_01270 [Chryseobacterium kwangjuense]